MAITFGAATTDTVSFTDTDLDSHAAFTYIIWTRPTTQTGDRRLLRKNSSGGATTTQVVWNAVDTNDLRFVTFRATTNSLSISTDGFSTNVWYCFAFTHSSGAGNRIYWGTLTSPMVEVTYGTQTVGSGTILADAGGPLGIGNGPNGQLTPWQGSIAWVSFIARELTLAEIQRWQYRPFNMTDTKLFALFGSNGLTNVPDWSGNGCTGTINGSSVSDNPPLGPPFGYGEYDASFAAAAAAGRIWRLAGNGGGLVSYRGSLAGHA